MIACGLSAGSNQSKFIVLPEDEYVGRVRKDDGKSGQGQQLPLKVKQRIDQLWKEIVTAKLGFQDLNEMRKALPKSLSPIEAPIEAHLVTSPVVNISN